MKKNVEAQKTPWYPSSAKPGRVGWYEVKCEHGIYIVGLRFFWDAYSWRPDDRGKRFAYLNECDKWRGLASKP